MWMSCNRVSSVALSRAGRLRRRAASVVLRAIGSSLALAVMASAGGCTFNKPAEPAPGSEPSPIAAASLMPGMSLGKLVDGDLGMGGGFLVAAAPDKIRQKDHDQAVAAAQAGEEAPAQMQAVRETTLADLNHDGFITLDEILAMVRAGLSDQEVSDRLIKTGYVFHMTPVQERYLTDRGVSAGVIETLHHLSNPGK